MQHVLPSGKGGNQHHQGRLRQVEIGDQAVHGLEAIAGINEDLRPFGLFLKAAVLVHQALQGPAGGGANADDPAPLCLGSVQNFGSFSGNHTQFAVHMMLQDILRLHRAEGTQAHVQRHKGGLNTLFPGLIQQLPGPVQTGCRGRGGADCPAVHGLVPFLILQLRLDVGRQGHLAQALQDLQEDPLIVEFHHPVAVLLNRRNRGGQLTVAEDDLVAQLHLPARLAQALPFLIAKIPQQKHLHGTAGGPVAQEPGGQHSGIVHHQAVTGAQIVQDIIKMPVRHFSGLPVQDTQPGGIPLFQRSLGNQLLGQIVPIGLRRI